MDDKIPQNITPAQLKDWLGADSDRPIIVDVRESDELDIASFTEQVVHLPLSQSLLWSEKLDNYLPSHNSIVVICHSGIRSWNFGIWLLERDCTYKIWNLKGGIDAWSREIDPSIPLY